MVDLQARSMLAHARGQSAHQRDHCRMSVHQTACRIGPCFSGRRLSSGLLLPWFHLQNFQKSGRGGEKIMFILCAGTEFGLFCSKGRASCAIASCLAIFLSPPGSTPGPSRKQIAHLSRDRSVARFTQCHQVGVHMCPTIGERDDVVHLLRWCVSSLLEAALTQRMSCDISVSNALPCSSISAIDLRIALILAVVGLIQPLMLLAVPLARELWATRISTWMCRLVRHEMQPPYRQNKKRVKLQIVASSTHYITQSECELP